MQGSLNYNHVNAKNNKTTKQQNKNNNNNKKTSQQRTQLIAHDKEVYDIAFGRGVDLFASVGGDASLRMFDLRWDLKKLIKKHKNTKTKTKKCATPKKKKKKKKQKKKKKKKKKKRYSVEESNAFRYAIHLLFLCRENKKVYLKKPIKVVFSHRVPDGSEKLTTVVSKPDHYTPIERTYMKENEEMDGELSVEPQSFNFED